jgi:hypothetical protein
MKSLISTMLAPRLEAKTQTLQADPASAHHPAGTVIRPSQPSFLNAGSPSELVGHVLLQVFAEGLAVVVQGALRSRSAVATVLKYRNQKLPGQSTPRSCPC